MDDVREKFQNLHEFVKAARFNLNRNNYDYIVGATETETTLARNRSSLDSIAFKPRVLRNVRHVDCTSTLFGRKTRLPVMIAPVGGLQLFWDGGVATVAEAAGEFGVPVMQSSATEPPLEEVARRAPDAHKIFQLYVRGDDDFVDDYYKRSQKAGYAPQFCFTVDLAHYSRRERDTVKRFALVRSQSAGTRDPVLARLGADRALQEAQPGSAGGHQGDSDRRRRADLHRHRHRRHLRDQSWRTRARSCTRRDGHPCLLYTSPSPRD